MKIELKDFYQDFMQSVWGTADASMDFSESSFVDSYSSYLLDAGELEAFDPVPFRSPLSRGLQVDGYAGDPLENEGVLTLIVSDFNQDESLGTLNRGDVERQFKKVERFYENCLQDDFYPMLEESSPGYGLAQMINQRKGTIRRLRLVLLSNRELRVRGDGIEEKQVAQTRTTYSVWDFSRLYRLVKSGKGKEDLDIDLLKDFNTPLPCLPAHLTGTEYQAYLSVVPGTLLADIYDKWGARLLEQNVRCFLQFRGKVNKGMRATIQEEPSMFFAYNNGITATAEDVETVQENGSLQIVRIKNLQIVNGGQTTASIFMGKVKAKADISEVFVQMKLSVVKPERTTEVVPLISEYANTQNKVNAADFFSNHPFHVRIEDFSRRIYAPAQDGSFQQTKWFYERARGQYLDIQSKMTEAEKRKFKAIHPRIQLFSKTDLAKFENVWERVPHIVSKGAQFNFAKFAEVVGIRWAASSDQFNEFYYRRLVARGIIFRNLEKIVSDQPWYDGGYRANVVAYTIAKLADMVDRKNKVLNFDSIWKNQKLSQALYDALVLISTSVHDVIVDTPEGIKNVTEWAKKPLCWEKTRKLDIPFLADLEEELLVPEEAKEEEKEAAKVQRVDDGIMAQNMVIELGQEFWRKAIKWCQEYRVGMQKDFDIMNVAANFHMKLPTEKQALHLMGVLERMRDEGCPFVRKLQ